MAESRRIQAALPALGETHLEFHAESAEVLHALGDAELERLSQIRHLGVAAHAFTGLNHSRLEYMLLQCAIIQLLPKFHAHHPLLSVSATAPLGDNLRASSAEELLKSWAILGNAGHLRHTFGAERVLFRHARRRDSRLRDLLMPTSRGSLKRWASDVIDEFREPEFHYVLALHRIAELPPHSRLKARLRRYISALVVPIGQLGLVSRDKEKLLRLRTLYKYVRLISLVTLDSYNSHHPVRFHLAGALLSLADLLESPRARTSLLALLESTAGCLADSLYLHPNATTVLKAYEVEGFRKLKRKATHHFSSPDSFRLFLTNLRQDAFGKPALDSLQHFCRITVPTSRFAPFRIKDNLRTERWAEKCLTDGRATWCGVYKNSFSKETHLDLFCSTTETTAQDIARLCAGTVPWFQRLISDEVEERFREFELPDELRNRMREEAQTRAALSARSMLAAMIAGLLKWLVLPRYRCVLPNNLPLADGIRMRLASGPLVADELDAFFSEDSLGNTIDEPARRREIQMLSSLVRASEASATFILAEPCRVKDARNKDVVEWDAVLITVSADTVAVSIAESKGGRRSRAEDGFKQLGKSLKVLRSGPRMSRCCFSRHLGLSRRMFVARVRGLPR